MRDDVDRLTPLGLMVLALLAEGDMHPYEMIRLMRLRKDDRLASITNGTMYHTVGRLERTGLVTEVGVDRDGNRPERTTYSVTPSGTRAVKEWVRRELGRADRPAEFRIALAEAHNLPREEVVALLTTRRDRLRDELDAHANNHCGAVDKGVPAQYLVEIERQERMLRADLDWIDSLLGRLAGDGLPWGVHEPSERYLAQRKAARL